MGTPGLGLATHLPDTVYVLHSVLVRRLCGAAPWRTENPKLNGSNDLENTSEHSNTWNVPSDFKFKMMEPYWEALHGEGRRL